MEVLYEHLALVKEAIAVIKTCFACSQRLDLSALQHHTCNKFIFEKEIVVRFSVIDLQCFYLYITKIDFKTTGNTINKTAL